MSEELGVRSYELGVRSYELGVFGFKISPHLPLRVHHFAQRSCSSARKWIHHLPLSLSPILQFR